MNFLCFGFVLCSLNCNLGIIGNHIVKIIGAAFVLAGLKELSLTGIKLEKGKASTIGILVCAAAAAAALFIMRIPAMPENVCNALLLIFTALCLVFVIAAQYIILVQLKQAADKLVNDVSLIEKICKKWQVCSVFSAIAIASEIMYRLTANGSKLNTISGLVLFPARVVNYFYVVFMQLAFIKARADFNNKHPI